MVDFQHLLWKSYCKGMVECKDCFRDDIIEKFTDVPFWIPQPDIVIVGQAPSLNRTNAGETFGARSKPVFDAFLKELGIPRYRAYTTNLAHCTVPGAVEGSVKRCLHWFRSELSTIDCKYVVLMGKQVYDTVLEGQYGALAEVVFHEGRMYYPFAHPMRTIYGTYSLDDFLFDARKVKASIEMDRSLQKLDAFLPTS